jgi:hypothetical protein
MLDTQKERKGRDSPLYPVMDYKNIILKNGIISL